MSPGEEKARQVLREAKRVDPFMNVVYVVGGELRAFGEVTSHDRITALKTFTATECELALTLPNLQGSVRSALERRLRALAKPDGGVRAGTNRTTSGWIGQP